jgi:anthranilate phosphoribosyltransferase
MRAQKEGDPELESLLVSGAEESARRLVAVLSGQEKGFAREMLLVNAMLAGLTQGAGEHLDDVWPLCTEALDSGGALELLHKWQRFSKSA